VESENHYGILIFSETGVARGKGWRQGSCVPPIVKVESACLFCFKQVGYEGAVGPVSTTSVFELSLLLHQMKTKFYNVESLYLIFIFSFF